MNDPTASFTADAVLSKALDRFYELRPGAQKYINLRDGKYWAPFCAFRAQLAVLCQRISQLVAANSLTTAEGEDLLTYILSEYDELPDLSETKAIGSCQILCMDTTPGAQTLYGTVAAGSKFLMPAFTRLGKTYPAVQYEILDDIRFAGGLLTYPASSASLKTVRCQATEVGAVGNTTQYSSRGTQNLGTPIDGSYDPRIRALTVTAAGGGSKPSDKVIRRFARSIVTGEYGPTAGAALYGVFRIAGVKHCIPYDDPTTASLKLLIADESWGGRSLFSSSRVWPDYVQAQLYDTGVVGFGCKVTVDGTINTEVAITASVALRDRNYLTDTSDVTAAIKAACVSYFDDREDWNTWNQEALKNAITAAHPKILTCTSAVVTGANSNLVAADELVNGAFTAVFHYQVVDSAVTITYSGPV